MEASSPKKATISKSILIAVLACCFVLLYSIRSMVLVYQSTDRLSKKLKLDDISARIASAYTSAPRQVKGDNLILCDSICKLMQAPTDRTDVNAYPGIRLDQLGQLVEEHPDVVRGYRNIIVHVGTNNVATWDPVAGVRDYERFSADEIKRLYVDLRRRIRSANPNAAVYASAILPRPVDQNVTSGKVAEVNAFLAAEFGARYLPSWRYFVDDGAPEAAGNGTATFRDYFRDDGLHLTDEGKRVLGECFRRALDAQER